MGSNQPTGTDEEISLRKRGLLVDGVLDLSYRDLNMIPYTLQTMNIHTLRCINNRISELPPLPPTLRVLHCSYNELTQLPDLPPTLVELQCSNNRIRKLPNLPPTLRVLVCIGNQLTQLPDLPPTLDELHCSNNRLNELSPLPPTLRILRCNTNQLTQLPDLPQTLVELQCSNNQLTQLPELSPILLNLMCNNNQLRVLPELSPNLRYLSCDNNQLRVLPELPASLQILECGQRFNPFIPIFDRLMYLYSESGQLSLEDLRDYIHIYHTTTSKGRNILAAQLTMPSLKKGMRHMLPENVMGKIGEYVSGRPGGLKQQYNAIRENMGLPPSSAENTTWRPRPASQGGKRKTRKTKYSNKKTHKRRRT
jgi:hypothetical protein